MQIEAEMATWLADGQRKEETRRTYPRRVEKGEVQPSASRRRALQPVSRSVSFAENSREWRGKEEEAWKFDVSLGLGTCIGLPDEESKKPKKRESFESVWLKEDASWLAESLKRRQSSWGGFGKKIVVRVPRSWRRSRRMRVIAWCEELGFQCVASAEAESTRLEIDRDERRIAALVAALDRYLLDDRSTSNNASFNLLNEAVTSLASQEREQLDAASQAPPDKQTFHKSLSFEAEDKLHFVAEHMRSLEPDVEMQKGNETHPVIPVDHEWLHPQAAGPNGLSRQEKKAQDIEGTETSDEIKNPEAARRSAEDYTNLQRARAFENHETTRSGETQQAGDTSECLCSPQREDEEQLIMCESESLVVSGTPSSRRSASPRSKLRRRRTIAARKASLTASPEDQRSRRSADKSSAARTVVGGWLTGEMRSGRPVVDCTRFSESAHGVVVARIGSKLRLATREEGQRWVALVGEGSLAWPSGRLGRGADGRHYYLPSLQAPADRLEFALVDLVMRFVGDDDDVCSAAVACWSWSRGAGRARAWLSSSRLAPFRWDRFASGTFLAEGAFKRVYRVDDGAALSAANLELLGDSAAKAVARELEVAFLVTQLGKRAPNFVETFEVGQANSVPPRTGWNRQRRSPRHTEGRWLYARMELCALGDLQAWVASLPDSLPTVDVALGLLFQMCFAVYAARAEYAMRHYDLKLLNFLAAAEIEPGIAYALGESTFVIRGCAVRAKLADFGTACLGSKNLDREPRAAFFTTLENAPIELLADGCEKIVRSFAADTFSLGLAALHLFTGDRPYEEILADVKCPPDLCASLAAVWLRRPAFKALARVARDVVTDDPEPLCAPGGERVDRTLFDTFYRFLVLFGVPDHLPHDVFRLARDILLEPPRLKTRRQHNALTSPDQDYATHRAAYSLENGNHPSIARARARLDSLGPEPKRAFLSMLDFDPANRPTMRALLLSPLFASLKSMRRDDHVLHVDTYKRDPDSTRIPLPDL